MKKTGISASGHVSVLHKRKRQITENKSMIILPTVFFRSFIRFQEMEKVSYGWHWSLNVIFIVALDSTHKCVSSHD